MRAPAAILLASVVFGLGGCTAPLSQADLDRQDDCRQQADRQFDKQNRYLMSEQDQTGTPFSSHGFPGDTTRGLDDLYRHDRMVDDCLHDAGSAPPAVQPVPRSSNP